MIYLEAANSFNQENEKEDRQRWMWRAYNNSNNSTAIQNMIKDCMETEGIFDIDSNMFQTCKIIKTGLFNALRRKLFYLQMAMLRQKYP